MAKYNDMYYVCWLIERMHRTTQKPHHELVSLLGEARIRHYMELADVFHCENPDKIVGELAEEIGIPEPPLYHSLPNEKDKPSVRPIAGVYSRIIKNAHPDDYTNGIINVFSSFLPPLISDYGNNLYWANKEYLVESYKEGALL
jgi:hypothetical protein